MIDPQIGPGKLVQFRPTTYPDFCRAQSFARGLVRFDFEINSQSASFLLDQIEALVDHGHTQIQLLITSPGGFVNDGLSLYDRLQYLQDEAGVEIEGRAMGSCASAAAAIVLQAARLRTAYPNTRFLLHEISGGGQGRRSELEDQSKELAILEEAVFDILSARLTLPRATLRRRMRGKEWWMGAGEALEIGLIDRVLEGKTAD